MKTISISKKEAGQFLLGRSFLTKKSTDILEVIKKLSCIQVDPIKVIARNHELVLWNRVENFQVADLYSLLYGKRELFEYWLQLYSLIPIESFPYVGARMHTESNWREEYGRTHQQQLKKLLGIFHQKKIVGPKDLAEANLKGAGVFSWKGESSRNALFQYLWDKGEILVDHRHKNQKFYALASTILPKKLQKPISYDQSISFYLKSHFDYIGLVRNGFPIVRIGTNIRADVLKKFAQWKETGVIIPVLIDGVKTKYWLHKDHLPEFKETIEHNHQGLNLLPPLDPVIIDRKLIQDIFDFEYRWEAYAPANIRKFGYYGMPILYNGQLVGQVDLKKDKNNIYINKLESKILDKEFKESLKNTIAGLKIWSATYGF